MAKRNILLIAGFSLVALLVVLLINLGRTPSVLEVHGDVRSSAQPQPQRNERQSDSSLPQSRPEASTSDRLNDIAAQLAAANDGATSRRLLAELRAFLDRLPRDAASRDVQSYLRSGSDAATKLDVTVGPGGLLVDASSLRVFLLDYLGQIDKPAAGAVAAEILSHYSTSDEWAVCLRNYAWVNRSPEGTAYLQGKAQELLSNSDWLANPTAGFLEAFDAIVYAKAASLTPQLTTLIRDKDNRAVGHAAFLTLDRLVIAEPAAVLQTLAAEPRLMDARSQSRANLFARADIRDSEQRSMLEKYLLDPRRTDDELQTFSGIYPNANLMISNNLLTTTSTPGREELIAHDASALAAVNEWLSDPQFQKLKPQLELIRSRLEVFVRQGKQRGR